MFERFANVTVPSGKQTEAGNLKLATGLANILKGIAEPATEGVSHLLKMVLPSVPVCILFENCPVEIR